MRTVITSGMAALALLASPAAAQSMGSAATRNYVDAAGQSDAFETLEADTALAQSSDPQVRAFAQQMLRDHDRLGQTLRQATARAGIMPTPMGVGADQAPLLAALQSLRGADFDRAYWRHQALAHRSALTSTERYATAGDSAPIRQAASEALTVITQHLGMAERMQAASGAP
jgi:putative membrane protein